MFLATLLLTAAFAAQATPVATTGTANSITTGSAVVTGTVNPGGDATTYQFEYGTSTGYGLTTPAQSAGAGSSAVDVQATLSGLTDTTTYHYRLVATNAAGVSRGMTALSRPARRLRRRRSPAGRPSP